MLKACGVEYVIIGHSERRQYFGETDATVNQRVKAAVAGGLIPIVCVGEKKEERESGYTDAIVQYQTLMALTGLSAAEVENAVIAYEPVWAIGTGLTATDEQANETSASSARRWRAVTARRCRQGAHPVRRQHEARQREGPHGPAGDRRWADRRGGAQRTGLHRRGDVRPLIFPGRGAPRDDRTNEEQLE
jgi:hypothetical protein